MLKLAAAECPLRGNGSWQPIRRKSFHFDPQSEAKEKDSPPDGLSADAPSGERKEGKMEGGKEEELGSQSWNILLPISQFGPTTVPYKETTKMKNKASSAPVNMRRRLWSWQNYLNQENAEAAPLALFTQSQSYPSKKNGFKVGMKLEGIDPLHPSMFCVLTVAEVIGYRLRLHIDGYSECYDFWVNADSPEIKPTGWCQGNKHRLHPPKGSSESEFDWPQYLQSTGAQAAPTTLFTCRMASCDFHVGMKLEAVDKKNPGLVCVASIADVIDDRFLVHFDNWDNSYDYWCDRSSPYVHPVSWCQEHGRPLTAPQDHPDPENFTWEEYLRETASKAAPRSAFTTRGPHGFQINQRLEAVDKRNPMLIRVATVTATEDYRVKVHYDGWSHHFDVWCDSDLCDLHPIGWCQRTGHPLEPPPEWSTPSQGACPTSGCRGVGHIKGPKYTGHHSAFGCPYSDINMRKELALPDRLGGVAVHHHGNQSEDRGSIEVKAEYRDSPLAPLVKRRRLSDRTTQDTKLFSVKQEEEELHHEGLGAAPESSLQAVLHQSVFLSSVTSQPSSDLSLCWEQHRKLLPGVAGVHASAVRHWSVQQVSEFIESLPGCEDLAKQFSDEQIDGRAFLLLTQRDIVRIMSIKLGPALKIYNSILMFKHAEHTSHDRDKNQSGDVDGNESNDIKQSCDKDDSQSHHEKNQSCDKDKKLSNDIAKKQSCDTDNNQSGDGDTNQLHDKNESHDSDKNQSCNTDKIKSCDEDNNQLHDKDNNNSHDMDVDAQLVM
uniref:lethal(3)malignant brain tumor-like protein 4 isoform X2 n=1 Tax=Doryrhamphus excisus TaxID=161450 RepID=UPI0025ADBA04|nr:lethal(3)malignant brain tumor-like protein 4 isoform X2 [Doryrhamphus excisus]